MKKYIVSLLFLLLAVLPLPAADSDWTYYLAYNNATQSLPVGDRVYALYAGNLLVYSPTDGAVTTFSRAEGLSGKAIARIAYSEAEGCLVIAYEDLNVDLLYEDGEVVNLPQLKNGNDGSAAFASLTVTGKEAVVATTAGLAHFDLGEPMFKNYYRIEGTVTSGTLVAGRLFAATTKGLLSCPLSGNPYDASQWTTDFDLPVAGLYPFAGGLYLQVDYIVGQTASSLGLWYATLAADGHLQAPVRITARNIKDGFTSGSHAAFLATDHALVFTPDNSVKATESFPAPAGWNSLAVDRKGSLWVAAGYDLLQNYTVRDGAPVDGGHKVGGYGPRRDLCYKLHFAGERLLVAGGRIDFSAGKNFEGTALYRDNDGVWRFLPDTDLDTQYDVPFLNVTDFLQDTADPAHHYVATGEGLFEYHDYKLAHHFSINNSALVAAAAAPGNPRYVRIDALSMDAAGNLFMTNSERDTTIQVLRPDGTWCGIYAEGIKGAQSCEKSLIDRDGRLWVTSRRTTSTPLHTSGLLCVDYNGTPANGKDDVVTYRSKAYNQDGTSCELEYVYDIAEDTDGQLWMGCASGVYVIDPAAWATSSFRVTQIKVPRNDGTNLADYLLAGVPVSAIAIDGGGRKWLGTLTNGLYLVSRDGTEVLAHYEAATSPLLSDCIYSLAIHPTTGEVMIGTDLGLCSVQGKASVPADGLVKSNIRVYPNPVRPEYRGDVTVTGLTLDADVKVTNTAGAVVAAGRSIGGSFTWNCRRANGARVATGVYYIMVATADGGEGVAAKVVVI